MNDDYLKLQQYKINLSNATPEIPFRTMDVYMNVLLECMYQCFKKICAHSPIVNL